MAKQTAESTTGEIGCDTSTLEHLKHFVGLVIDGFQEGTGPLGAVLGPDMAKAMIWQELQRCLGRAVDTDIGFAPAWLRLTKPSATEVDLLCALQIACEKVQGAHIGTYRWIGPRGESAAVVAYAVVHVAEATVLLSLLIDLRAAGVEVRDGTYNSAVL